MALNRVILIGRLTKEVELRYTPAGKGVSNFTLAVDRDFKNAQGEKETDFINIVVWGKLAEVCANYLSKGKMAAVEGRMQNSNYEKDGVKHYKTEIVADNVQFLSPYDKREEEPAESARQVPGIPDDDLPF